MNITKRIEQKVISFINEKNLLTKNDRVLIALSGGPDSVFLLTFLNKFRKKFSIALAALHVNHKLRGKDSDADAQFCSKLCESVNIPFYDTEKNITLIAKQNKISFEEAGRITRYEELEKTARFHDYNKIATAHVADDNTETILLNLIKGTGLKGIAGIPVMRGKIIRPVLCLQKDEVLTYLKANKTGFRTDKSNFDNKYERNFIRNELIPKIKTRLNPNLDDTVLRSSQVFRNYVVLVDGLLTKLKKIVIDEGEWLSIRLIDLRKHDPIVLSELIITAVQEKFKIQLSYKDIRSVLKLIPAESSRRFSLTDGLIALRERDSLKLGINKKQIIPQTELRLLINQEIKTAIGRISITEFKFNPGLFSADRNVEYINAKDLDESFVIRAWKKGDKFKPFGMSGTKNISDYLNELKIPASEKKQKLVMLNRNRIVWVIGFRIDDAFKITSKTRKVIRLCLD